MCLFELRKKKEKEMCQMRDFVRERAIRIIELILFLCSLEIRIKCDATALIARSLNVAYVRNQDTNRIIYVFDRAKREKFLQ